jgi:hypothetical protein
VEIKPGQATRLQVGLQRLSGTLVVVTDVPGAVVTVDGQPAGQGPVASLKLGAGSYRVQVDRPGYRTWRRTATLLAGQSLQLVASLRPVEVRSAALRPAIWTSLAIGTAALGAGAGLAVLVRSRQRELEEASGEFLAGPVGLQRSGKTLSRAAIASFAAGGAGLLTAVTLFIVERTRRGEARRWPVEPLVSAGPGGAAAGLRWSR